MSKNAKKERLRQSDCRKWCGTFSKEQPASRVTPTCFPSVGGTGPFNSFSEGMNEIRDVLPYDMPNLSMHDLRRTARKLMTRAGRSP